MTELSNNNIANKVPEIKEITISNKKTYTSKRLKYSNGINIIPIKIAFSPKIDQNITENFNLTSRNLLYEKNKKNNNIEKKNSITNKRIFMTPKIESNFSNNSPSVTTPRVIIKNFNYNNVYNISIDKDKDKNKNSVSNISNSEYKSKKYYQNYTYNKPKTTSNINIKNDNNNSNNISYNINRKFSYSRINSEKNILSNRKIKINLINKNEINNINDKKIFHVDIRKNLLNSSIKTTDTNNYYVPFNLSDINTIFEKIYSIIISLSKNQVKNIYINCQEFFVFYNNCSLKKLFSSFFKNNHKIILDSAINLCLFSFIIIYNISSENLMTNNMVNIIERVLLFCKINFALFIKQIQIKYSINNLESLFQKYLINKSITNITKEEDLIKLIYQNSKAMTNDIKLILNFYKSINIKTYNKLITKFNNISIQSESDFISFFFNEICKTNINHIITINKINNISKTRNISMNSNNSHINCFSPKRRNAFENLSIKKNNNGSNNNSSINNKLITKKVVKRKKESKIENPFIKSPLMKKYTLILSLDKTLSFKNNSTGEIILRNGLFSFLSSIKPFFELILFSIESKEFCEPIINMIEQDKKYFDFKFYKEHSVLYKNNLIKDISLIGRDLSKIIIVDNNEICFELNKENGIKISSFNGENNNDNKLFELKNILKKIYFKNFDDVRMALKELQNDIVNKVTLD